MVENRLEETLISSSDDTIYMEIDVLRQFMKDVFVGLEVPDEDAEIIADVLITSDLRGVDSHGMTGLKQEFMIQKLR